MQTLLIAGTNAQVGKTVVLAALAAYWQRYRTSQVGVMKPIDCARPSRDPSDRPPEADCERLQRLLSLPQTSREITPVRLAVSSLLPEFDQIDFEQIWQALQQLQQRYDLVLLEALGGLGTPLTAETTAADLAWDWRLPTVLVVPVQPNMVADIVANVALANQSRLHLKGIILNQLHPDSWPNYPADHVALAELIQSLTRKPVLGYIPHLDPNNHSQLAQAAAGLALEYLLPSLERVG